MRRAVRVVAANRRFGGRAGCLVHRQQHGSMNAGMAWLSTPSESSTAAAGLRSTSESSSDQQARAATTVDVEDYALYSTHRPTSLLQKGLLAAGSAVAAILNPERADMVATLGETTGHWALRSLHARMAADPTGRLILHNKPAITEEVLQFDRLLTLPENTLGGAYARWMRSHGFTPSERQLKIHVLGRPAVRFVDDVELAYVMKRYREVHDFWHVLTGVPTTVVGEIALKWFEMYQTGLPMTALSAVVGPLRLPVADMRALARDYIPWARRSATNATFLLNYLYEAHMEDSLDAVRQELRLEPWCHHSTS